MESSQGNYEVTQQLLSASRLKDLEETVYLLKERLLLIGQTLIQNKERTSLESEENKKMLIQLKRENERLKELLERVLEQLGKTARKEELMIIKRQVDLLRG